MNDLIEKLFEEMSLEDKKKIIEELMGNEIKDGKEEIRENKEKIINGVNKMLDDAFCFLATTNNGITMIGTDTCLLTCIDVAIQKMIKRGVSKKTIQLSINKALEGVEDE